jgi:hypothetical protein
VIDGLDGSGLAVGGPSAAVHWPQNLNPGGFWNWHLGQTSVSGALHWPQNFIPSGFSEPHFEQRINLPESQAIGLLLYHSPSDRGQRDRPRMTPRSTAGACRY